MLSFLAKIHLITWGRHLAILLAFAPTVTLASTRDLPLTPTLSPPIPRSILSTASKELSSIYRGAVSSVVVIESPPMPVLASSWESTGEERGDSTDNQIEEELPPSEEELSDTASGIIFSQDGHILTNHHVIQHILSDHARVKLRDGRLVNARIIGSDPKTDIAVLQLPAIKNPPASLNKGNSDLVEVGDFVCAIGSPYGLEYSLSVGVVSGRGRNPLTYSAYEDYIQTDAAINPGNSGGPLLNASGEWIGVNTLINGINRGLGFAVPSNQAYKIANEIISRGEVLRPWLGIRALANPKMEEGLGVEISWVAAESPASRAGVRPKDIILRVDGESVRTPADLQKKIWSSGIGGTMTLEFRRGKSTKVKKLKTVEMPENEWVH